MPLEDSVPQETCCTLSSFAREHIFCLVFFQKVWSLCPSDKNLCWCYVLYINKNIATFLNSTSQLNTAVYNVPQEKKLVLKHTCSLSVGTSWISVNTLSVESCINTIYDPQNCILCRYRQFFLVVLNFLRLQISKEFWGVFKSHFQIFFFLTIGNIFFIFLSLTHKHLFQLRKFHWKLHTPYRRPQAFTF